MTILVLGRSGQLARALQAAGEARGLPMRCAGRDEADLADPGAAAALIAAVRPALVVNAAAYTAVDRAEQEEKLAFRINADGAGEAAAAAAAVDAPFVQVSTDYVFADGGPHDEDAPARPCNAYGRSKLAGERAVRVANPRHLIVRTSWLYDAEGQNFVRTMLRLAGERDHVGVVDDQLGCPTAADDLADALLRVMASWQGGGGEALTLHLAGSEAGSWADLADAVFAASRARGGPAARVRRIATADFPTPAMRPRDSRLDCRRASDRFGVVLPGYSLAVPRVVAALPG